MPAQAWAVSGPNEPPRSDRAIADSWRGLYGSHLFSSIALSAPANDSGMPNIAGFAGFQGCGQVRIMVPLGDTEALPRWLTLAIRNLTGSGAGRILKTGIRGRIRVGHQTATDRTAAAAWPVRQAVAAHHSAGDDRGSADLCPDDRLFPGQPAERPAGGGQYRGPGAGRRAVRHGAGIAGPADPEQHRRTRGRDQDGPAAPAFGQRRPAAQDRSRHRYAQ